MISDAYLFGCLSQLRQQRVKLASRQAAAHCATVTSELQKQLSGINKVAMYQSESVRDLDVASLFGGQCVLVGAKWRGRRLRAGCCAPANQDGGEVCMRPHVVKDALAVQASPCRQSGAADPLGPRDGTTLKPSDMSQRTAAPSFSGDHARRLSPYPLRLELRSVASQAASPAALCAAWDR
jgi:hypothetical protein